MTQEISAELLSTSHPF